MIVRAMIPFLLSFAQHTTTASPLQIIHSFKTVKYIEGYSSEYNGSDIIIIDVDYWKDPITHAEKVFVTTPRAKPGTPASLSTIITGANNESLLSPYPTWLANQETCEGIVSAFRTQIDSCNRLWVIDAGVIDIFTETNSRICPPKIWIYDLTTDSLISQAAIPENILKPESLLTTIAVDVRDKACDEAFAYIADPVSFMVVVFSFSEKNFWYFRNRLLYPYPIDGNFKINKVSFDLMDGVIGLALGPVISGDRTLYLHSLASRRESTVQTSVLQNSELGGDSDADLQKFKVSYGERSSQSVTEAVWDKALYFNLLGQNTLACWPITAAYSKNNINKLYKNETMIQFVSGIKAISGHLWILSSTFQTYITNTFNENIVNYRVIKISINKLTHGKGCRRLAF